MKLITDRYKPNISTVIWLCINWYFQIFDFSSKIKTDAVKIVELVYNLIIKTDVKQFLSYGVMLLEGEKIPFSKLNHEGQVW